MQIRCIIAKVLDKLVLELHYTLQYNATFFNLHSSIAHRALMSRVLLGLFPGYSWVILGYAQYPVSTLSVLCREPPRAVI